MPTNNILLFFVQFFTGYLLQGASFVLFIYAFHHKKVVISQYAITTLCMTIFIFISRNMNVNFGVHTILNILLLVFFSVFYLKFSVTKSTIAALLGTLIILLLEVVNIGAMMLIFTPSVFEVSVKDPLWNALTAIPVTVIMFLGVFLYYLKTRRGQPSEGAQ